MEKTQFLIRNSSRIRWCKTTHVDGLIPIRLCWSCGMELRTQASWGLSWEIGQFCRNILRFSRLSKAEKSAKAGASTEGGLPEISRLARNLKVTQVHPPRKFRLGIDIHFARKAEIYPKAQDAVPENGVMAPQVAILIRTARIRSPVGWRLRVSHLDSSW